MGRRGRRALTDTRTAARAWIDAWSRGWREHDPELIAERYAEDAYVLTAPFREPRVGGAGIAAYACEAFEGEEFVECWFGEPIVAGDRASVEWRAVGVFEGRPYTLEGHSKLRFGPDGLVVDHREYWHESDRQEAAPEGWGR